MLCTKILNVYHAVHIPSVCQSYKLIFPELRQALLTRVAALESVPDIEKDWHPGNDKQVLDLIHPSLYCFRIGKSAVKNADDGTSQPYIQQRPDLIHHTNESPYYLSEQHQWLPTDFEVSETGEVMNVSYINNLHPDRKSLYATLNSIVERLVPLWERVLSDVLSPSKLCCRN